MRRPLLEVRDLWAGYDGEAVVRNISFTVSEGEMVALVGPNGSGKTTIMKVVAGLLRPLKGDVIKRVRIGYVPQQKAVKTHFPLTVRQFVMTGLYPKMGLLHRKYDQKAFNNILHRLGLAEHAEKTLSEISGGTLRKAMVARALVSYSPLLLLDEPNAELDTESEKQLFEILYNLREEGHGILFVSPKQADIPKADTVLYLEHGVVARKDQCLMR